MDPTTAHTPEGWAVATSKCYTAGDLPTCDPQSADGQFKCTLPLVCWELVCGNESNQPATSQTASLFGAAGHLRDCHSAAPKARMAGQNFPTAVGAPFIEQVHRL